MAGEHRECGEYATSAAADLPCEIVRLDEVVHRPSSDVACDVLEWHFLDAKKHGDFKIRLLCLSVDGGHRYWIQPW